MCIRDRSCTGDSCFGNDVKVCVINETGGREVMISTALTAPVAYLRAFYRHNIMLQKRLDEMERAEAARHRGSRARVGSGARVINCGAVTDVEIADGARVEGSRRLTTVSYTHLSRIMATTCGSATSA